MKNINNYPSTNDTNYLKAWFYSIKKKITLPITRKLEEVKLDKIIKEFQTIDEYNVLSSAAFMQKLLTSTKNSNTYTPGTLIFMDINDLYLSNLDIGKKRSNLQIKELIEKAKNLLQTYKIEDYDIGKMGDEILVYIEDKSSNECKKIIDKLSKIKTKKLSLSLGSCDDFKNGVEVAKKRAEEKMKESKKKHKFNKLQEVCGSDTNKIVSYIILKTLQSARIDIENIKKSNQIMDFVNTFNSYFNSIDLDNIFKNVEQKSQLKLDSKYINNSLSKQQKLREKYEAEAHLKLGINCDKDLIEKYIEAQSYIRTPIDGTITDEYFKKSQIKRVNEKKPLQILAVNLSGLKSINDTLGYDKGDESIEHAIEYIKATLENNDIHGYTDLVMRGSGDAYVFTAPYSDSVNEHLSDDISKYSGNLTVLSTIQKEDITQKDLIKEDLNLRINRLLSESENILSHQSTKQKITSKENLENLIENIYEKLYNVILQSPFNTDFNDMLLEDISKKIKDEFRKIITPTVYYRTTPTSVDIQQPEACKEKIYKEEK